MPLPKQVQVFSAFLGTYEGISATLLPEVFSSEGSQNVWMDKYGRVAKVLGYAKANSNAVTTDTGGSATAVTGFFPYRDTSGGSTTRVLVGVFNDGADEVEIHTSSDNGATWTFRTELTTTVSFQDDLFPDFAQFGDELYVAWQGRFVPRRSADGTTYSAAGGTQSPTPSATDAATSGNLTGTYEYKLVSVDSDGNRSPGSAASSSIQVSDSQIDLSWTADSDTNIVGYEVYRTTGTGKVFYFVDYVDGRNTTAFNGDNSSDLQIRENRVLEEHGDAPPQVYFCEPHKGRMWWARTDANPRRAFYSDPGDADSVWTDNNFIDFTDVDLQNDVITGMFGNFEGRLVVFLERGIFNVSGSGQVVSGVPQWNRSRTNAGMGTVSIRSVVKVPAGAKFVDQFGNNQTTPAVTLAYFTPNGDIRIFDGDNDIVISTPMADKLSELAFSRRHQTFAVHDTERQQITWFFPDDTDASGVDGAVTWNYRFGVWTEYVAANRFSAGVEIDTASDANVLVLGEGQQSTGGFVYTWWSGNGFDGSNIDARWFTKPLFAVGEEGSSLFHRRKRYREVEAIFDAVSGPTVTLEWFTDMATSSSSAEGSTTTTTAGVDSGDSHRAKLLLKNGSGNYPVSRDLRLRFSDNSTNSPWALEAFSLIFQVKEGI